MKPRTKSERRVVELSSELNELTTSQIMWAKKNLFTHYVKTNRQGHCICEDCGYEWNQKNIKKGTHCPSCHARLTPINDSIHKREFRDYYGIITTCGEYQVFRYFQVCKYTNVYKGKTEKAQYSIYEVLRKWIKKGHSHVMARLRNMSWLYNDSWYGDMEIRQNRMNYYNYVRTYDLKVNFFYPRIKLLKELIDHGYTSDCKGLNKEEVFSKLIMDNKFETLWKTNQTELFHYFETPREISKVWDILKICFRHNYKPVSWNDWFDSLIMLQKLKMDTHNPQYICPKNFMDLHDTLRRRIEKNRLKEEEKKRRENILQKLAEEKEEKERYLKEKRNFLGLQFSDGNIDLHVLQSVEEFAEEAIEMRHCVYSMEYYKKPASLIFSARVKGKREETVEVNLNNYEIVQSRAVCNGMSKYHDEIIKLVNKNMKQIKQCSLSKVS